MKILITGGAGFIGSQIAEAYLHAGHEVHIMDNLATGKRENIPASARFIEMDITDPEVARVLAEERYEVISHHAAQIDVRKSVADPMFDARVNILGGINLVENGLKHGLKKVIFASSGGTVYGEQHTFPATEQHSCKPISPYGIAKLSFEQYLYYYHTCFGLEYAAMRYANVYGPRQNPHGEAGVVAIFISKILAGAQAMINGDGLQTRDYVFVEDLVRANVLALGNIPTGAYNIGTAIETNVVEVFDAVNAALGNRFERKHAEAKTGEQKRSVLDYGHTKSILGWQPEIDFEAGIAKTVAWFQAKHN
jgi:UDP-glucose 4-epimerase